MQDDWHKKLLQKELTRKQFLQFIAASTLVVLGFGNLMTLIRHFATSTTSIEQAHIDASHGFGSRKFGA